MKRSSMNILEVLSPVPEGYDERILRDAPLPDPHRPCLSVLQGLRPRSPVTASLFLARCSTTRPPSTRARLDQKGLRRRSILIFLQAGALPPGTRRPGDPVHSTAPKPFYAFSHSHLSRSPTPRRSSRPLASRLPLATQHQQHVIAHTQPRNRATPPRTQTQATQAYTDEACTRTSTLFSFPRRWQLQPQPNAPKRRRASISLNQTRAYA